MNYVLVGLPELKPHKKTPNLCTGRGMKQLKTKCMKTRQLICTELAFVFYRSTCDIFPPLTLFIELTLYSQLNNTINTGVLFSDANKQRLIQPAGCLMVYKRYTIERNRLI